MTEMIHKDMFHVQDDSPLVELEHNPASDQYIVPVKVINSVATTTAATQFGTYETVVIPASGNQLVLPYDPLRQYAYIMAIDADIVITTVREQAQSPNNQVANVPNPSGAYNFKGIWTPAIRHNDAVFVANTSNSPNRVSILIERGSTEANNPFDVGYDGIH